MQRWLRRPSRAPILGCHPRSRNRSASRIGNCTRDPSGHFLAESRAGSKQHDEACTQNDDAVENAKMQFFHGRLFPIGELRATAHPWPIGSSYIAGSIERQRQKCGHSTPICQDRCFTVNFVQMEKKIPMVLRAAGVPFSTLLFVSQSH